LEGKGGAIGRSGSGFLGRGVSISSRGKTSDSIEVVEGCESASERLGEVVEVAGPEAVGEGEGESGDGSARNPA